jgi:hypothetical protein
MSSECWTKSHYVKKDNRFLEKVAEFVYSLDSATLKTQNYSYIHEKVKRELKLGDALYHSVPKYVSISRLKPKD